MFFISIYIYTTNAKNIEKMPTIKPKGKKGNKQKRRHEKERKKVAKKERTDRRFRYIIQHLRRSMLVLLIKKYVIIQNHII